MAARGRRSAEHRAEFDARDRSRRWSVERRGRKELGEGGPFLILRGRLRCTNPRLKRTIARLLRGQIAERRHEAEQVRLSLSLQHLQQEQHIAVPLAQGL